MKYSEFLFAHDKQPYDDIIHVETRRFNVLV